MPQNISNWKEEFDEMVLMVSKIPSTERVFALDLKSSVPLMNGFASKLQALATEMINELKSNPNPDGSESPNIQHWVERKQTQLKKLVAKKWGLI